MAGYWQKRTNRKKYFDWLFKLVGFSKMDDWYGIKWVDISHNGCGMSNKSDNLGGAVLLSEYYSGSPGYNNFTIIIRSPAKALLDVYPGLSFEV
jgi:hypothetical protein